MTKAIVGRLILNQNLKAWHADRQINLPYAIDFTLWRDRYFVIVSTLSPDILMSTYEIRCHLDIDS